MAEEQLQKSLTMVGEVLPKRPLEGKWEMPTELILSKSFTDAEKDVIVGYMRYSNNAEIAKKMGISTSMVTKGLQRRHVIAEIKKQYDILRAKQEAARSDALFRCTNLTERQNKIVAGKARGLSDEDISAITGIDVSVVKTELRDERVRGQLDVIYRERAEARKQYKYQDVLNDGVDLLHQKIKDKDIDARELVNAVKTLGKFVGDDTGTSKLTIIAENVQVNKDVQVLPNGEKPSW